MSRRNRVTITIVAFVLALAIGAGAAAPLQAQETIVHFRMPYLESFKTTELGEDEIYVIVIARWADGTTRSYRFPDQNGHWDLNDQVGDPPVENWPLLRIPMRPGTAMDLLVLVMEEDGGTVGGWAAMAASAAGVINKGAGAVIAAIARFIPPIEDKDDFIGSFNVHIERTTGGELLTTFTPRDRTFEHSDPSRYWIQFFVNMNGDGSEYRSNFSVTDGLETPQRASAPSYTPPAPAPSATAAPPAPRQRPEPRSPCGRC